MADLGGGCDDEEEERTGSVVELSGGAWASIVLVEARVASERGETRDECSPKNVCDD